MPCDYTASLPAIQRYLQHTIELAYLRDLTSSQLNDLYDQCVWKLPVASKGSDAERKDKVNLVAWILRNMPTLKHPELKMPTKALLDGSMALRLSEVGAASQDQVQIKAEPTFNAYQRMNTLLSKTAHVAGTASKTPTWTKTDSYKSPNGTITGPFQPGALPPSKIAHVAGTPSKTPTWTKTDSYKSPNGTITGPFQPGALPLIEDRGIFVLQRQRQEQQDAIMHECESTCSSPACEPDGFAWLNSLPDDSESDVHSASGLDSDQDADSECHNQDGCRSSGHACDTTTSNNNAQNNECDQTNNSSCNQHPDTGPKDDRTSTIMDQDLILRLAGPLATIMQACKEGNLGEALLSAVEAASLITAAARQERHGLSSEL
ncbi:hypothetical protein CLAFUW4_14831 [Fulvia fulva]|nr:hypothetical protein CLAFUR0_14824 [Fulvia fulva]WPV23023.1 hypothetical protein CLAFUW4_14831 [Fulvia fulva]WPV37936.1 hypothetical protein CLAFUW7_14832 [Fulvia fulva]